MTSIDVTWTEYVMSRENRKMEIDADKWREIIGYEFDPLDKYSDEFETYMAATGTEAESLDYSVYSRNVFILPGKDN